MSAVMNTIIGAWSPDSSSPTTSTSPAPIDLEAQVVLGRREPIPYPAATIVSPAPVRTSTPRASSEGSDPVADFFGVMSMRDTQDSRHSERRTSFYLDAPPPYASDDAAGLPSYASVAEPPTLAMYLFKFGFLFPLFWLAGVFVLLCPLSAPEGWEPTKSEAEREELLVCLRRTEIKWAKRCLVAFSVFTFAIVAIILIALFAKRM